MTVVASTTLSVSVIVSTAGWSPRLEGLVADLGAQTLPAEQFEVVFVDADSSDATFARLNRLVEGRATWRALQLARLDRRDHLYNAGLAAARGDYVLLLYDDDGLDQRALELAVDQVRRHAVDAIVLPSAALDTPAGPTSAPPDPLRELGGTVAQGRALLRRSYLRRHDLQVLPGAARLDLTLFALRGWAHATSVAVTPGGAMTQAAGAEATTVELAAQSPAFWREIVHAAELLTDQPGADGRSRRAAPTEMIASWLSHGDPDPGLTALLRDQIATFGDQGTVDDTDLRLEPARAAIVLRCTTARPTWAGGRLHLRTSAELRFADDRALQFDPTTDDVTWRVPGDLVDSETDLSFDVTAAIATATVHVVARERGSRREWTLPGVSTVEVTSGRLVLGVQATVDPQRDGPGAGLGDGVLDLFVRFDGLGIERTAELPHVGPRQLPALLDGRPSVAYRTQAGWLALDVGGGLHDLFELALRSKIEVGQLDDHVALRVSNLHVWGDVPAIEGEIKLGGYGVPARITSGPVGPCLELAPDARLSVAPRGRLAVRRTHTLDEIGVRHGIDQSSVRHGYLDDYQRWIDDLAPRTVVIISGQTPELVARTFAEFLPDATVHLLTVKSEIPALPIANVRQRHCPDVSDIARYLLEIPAPDLVIEDGTNRSSHKAACFRAAFLHLRPGGIYLGEDLHAHHLDQFRDAPEGLSEYLQKLMVIKRDRGRAAQPDVHRDDVERARAVRTLTDHGKFVVVERTGDHLVKVRDDDLDAVVAARLGPGRSTELFARPSLTTKPRCTLTVSRSRTAPDRFHPRMVIPALRARRYTDVVCAPRQLVLLDDVLPSIAFHHPLGNRLSTRTTRDVGVDVAELRSPLAPPRRLAGSYYHLDSEYPGHFGHFMTEDLGRLWGWREAKRLFPELRLLVSTDSRGGDLRGFQRTLLNAYGIGDDDIVCIDGPVRVDELVGVSPMFHNGRFVHPELTQVWADIGRALVPRHGPATRKLFISRPDDLNRRCHNGAEVEEVFRAAGFEVLYPESLSLLDQVTLFAEAAAVAGYGGSGMFNSVFSRPDIVRIVIASEAYNATNEWLIAGAQGGEYHHFWCAPDIPQTKGSWSATAFHSDFTFDLDRHGPTLKKLLKRL